MKVEYQLTKQSPQHTHESQEERIESGFRKELFVVALVDLNLRKRELKASNSSFSPSTTTMLENLRKRELKECP